MCPNKNIKNLISEIYVLNFFQKCKLIEKIENIIKNIEKNNNSTDKTKLKKIETKLIEIKKLQDSLLEKALKNNKNNDKIGLLKNLLSKSKTADIKLLEKKDNNKDSKNLDDLINKLWEE